MFIDQAEIQIRSGKGGDGVVHFRREKYVPRGGPDGGDGGRGGDVILEVKPTLNTLSTFRHQARYHAQDGLNGAKQNMTGRSGEDRHFCAAWYDRVPRQHWRGTRSYQAAQK